ncbi:alpha-hydroxy-acid oxidizing protein [Bradyrhizobium archetypum]|uniref:alpha-hydroxy-acid oxidizing protein n=1 Tax=Bradyrhizobium archetypum TaxID=2721160 RepID=UPI0035D5B978
MTRRPLSGRSYAHLFCISPVSLVGRPNADLMLAQTAQEANIPYLMLSASNASIEAAAKVAPHKHAFISVARPSPRSSRPWCAGPHDLALSTLVVTVDLPVTLEPRA